jgi:hypothetical protein
MDNEQHIGDGLYASFDGFMIKLRAPRGPVDHEVFLEDWVWRGLLDYVRQNAPETWKP